MQVALGQVLPALGQEVARLIHVVRNCLSVGCGQRFSSCRGFAVGYGLSRAVLEDARIVSEQIELVSVRHTCVFVPRPLPSVAPTELARH